MQTVGLYSVFEFGHLVDARRILHGIIELNIKFSLIKQSIAYCKKTNTFENITQVGTGDSRRIQRRKKIHLRQ